MLAALAVGAHFATRSYGEHEALVRGGTAPKPQAPTAVAPPEAPPAYGLLVPVDQQRPQEAKDKAQLAEAAYAASDLKRARELYVEAFLAKPELEYSLKLGQLFHADGELDPNARDALARGWWGRHLSDEKRVGNLCEAREQILRIFPELKEQEK
jgi:hypothetical protein